MPFAAEKNDAIIYPYGDMVSSVFDVMAESNRRKIVELLCDGEQSVNTLVDALEVSQPAVSKHLRILRDAGLVETRVDANRRLYRLRPEPFQELDAWLAPYRTMWEQRLDDLGDHLDDMDDTDG